MDFTSVTFFIVYTIAVMISGLMIHGKVDLTSAILFVIFYTANLVSILIVNHWYDWSFLKSVTVSFFGALLFMIISLSLMILIFSIIEKIKER
jgi:hypothetical protein